MELSIQEAESRLTEAAAAAARGERVVITRHGLPFVEIVAVRGPGGLNDETATDRAARVRRDLGLEGLTVRVGSDLDDPAFSRQVLGLTD